MKCIHVGMYVANVAVVSWLAHAVTVPIASKSIFKFRLVKKPLHEGHCCFTAMGTLE